VFQPKNNEEIKLIIAPASGERARLHFQKTVEHLWTLDELQKLAEIPDEVVLKLKHHQPFAIWGLRAVKRLETLWKRISEGDVILFYANRRLIRWGRIVCKLQHAELSKQLWESSGGLPWELLIFISDVKALDIVFRDFISMFLKYKERFIPQTLVVVDQSRMKVSIQEIIKYLQEVSQ